MFSPCLIIVVTVNYVYDFRFAQEPARNTAAIKVIMKKIITVCLNPTLQKTLVFPDLIPDNVNRTVRNRLDASGKGINVSRVLAQLGKNCVHLTHLGGSTRPLFLNLCAQDKLKINWVESYSPIRFCYTVIVEKNRSVTELVEEGEKVDEQTGERLLMALDKILAVPAQEISALVISGSKAAGFSDTLFSEMVRRVKAKPAPVILDIRGKDLLECLRFKPDFIKPNLHEFASTFAPELVRGNVVTAGNPGDINVVRDRISGICGDIYKKYGVKSVISRGTDPLWYFEKDKLEEFAIDPAEPLNTTGSGDAFTAGFASAWCDGASMREAVAEGARCGKLNALSIRPGDISGDS